MTQNLTWLVDQLGAATEENMRLGRKAERLASLFSPDPAALAKLPKSPSLDVMFKEVLQELLGRQIKNCGHLASPAPTFVRYWEKPHVARCIDCEVATPNLTHSDVEQWTCDSCRVYHFEDCASQAISRGPITVFAGFCTGCLEAGR